MVVTGVWGHMVWAGMYLDGYQWCKSHNIVVRVGGLPALSTSPSSASASSSVAVDFYPPSLVPVRLIQVLGRWVVGIMFTCQVSLVVVWGFRWGWVPL